MIINYFAMKNYLTIAILLLSALFITSCSDDNDPSTEADIYDIVCLESSGDNGSVFTLSKPDSNDIITLTAPQRINTKLVPEGNRLLLRYVPEGGKAYTSGPVTVKGYGTIVNGKLNTCTPEELEGWDKTPVYLLSCWRSGNFLNIYARLPYDNTPRAYSLSMEENPANPTYPDLYLIHALETDVNTFSRAYYSSFDITELCANPDIEGFTLHVNNSNLHLDEIKFEL